VKDPSLPVQKAIYAALVAALDPGVGVHDRVPVDAQNRVTAAFPFVAIGEDDVVSDADQCHDASTIHCTIHVWSRAVGRVEAKTIMARVVDVLDAILPVDGFRMIAHQVEMGPRDVGSLDGLTSHRIATLRYRLGPTA
jgi:hypothetical protein